MRRLRRCDEHDEGPGRGGDQRPAERPEPLRGEAAEADGEREGRRREHGRGDPPAEPRRERGCRAAYRDREDEGRVKQGGDALAARARADEDRLYGEDRAAEGDGPGGEGGRRG